MIFKKTMFSLFYMYVTHAGFDIKLLIPIHSAAKIRQENIMYNNSMDKGDEPEIFFNRFRDFSDETNDEIREDINPEKNSSFQVPDSYSGQLLMNSIDTISSFMPGMSVGRNRNKPVSSDSECNKKDMERIRLSFSVENDVWTVSAPELGLSATCDSICYAVYNLYRQIDRTDIFDRPFRDIVSESGGKIVFRFREENP